eukprot:CAMPEP_0178525466 /NCGR_PEP_ID=MMETSP0696-20121128/30197_1 /TAXON_ID=265572 /ORGANISM="Extubocellulus spinifer, Strain CCMP396" /LENGTH=773 /DNA_ID=CAMNT_0020156881 /DNA_START=57 /DNA_END=2376 /DNA_ORIENTATION=-
MRLCTFNAWAVLALAVVAVKTTSTAADQHQQHVASDPAVQAVIDEHNEEEPVQHVGPVVPNPASSSSSTGTEEFWNRYLAEPYAIAACSAGGGIEVKRVGNEVCLYRREGICKDGYKFGIVFDNDDYYLQAWSEHYPDHIIYSNFKGAEYLCIGEAKGNNAYLKVGFEGGVAWLMCPDVGNRDKLPRLKIRARDDYDPKDPKYRNPKDDEKHLVWTPYPDKEKKNKRQDKRRKKTEKKYASVPETYWTPDEYDGSGGWEKADPTETWTPGGGGGRMLQGFLDTIVKFRDGADEDDMCWQIFLDGQTSKNPGCKWILKEPVPPEPSAVPSPAASESPTLSTAPSDAPSSTPSVEPTLSNAPSSAPSDTPSAEPSLLPSSAPSGGPSSEPSALPSSVPSGNPTESMMPSGAPSDEPSDAPSGFPSTECQRDNVNNFQELIAAIGGAMDSGTLQEIIVCPGTITFTDIIDFSGKFFELRCLDGEPPDACVFDLNQHSFVTTDASVFFAGFQNILIKNGNSATNRGDGTYSGDGGGAFLLRGRAIRVLVAIIQATGCSFISNTAGRDGGAVYVDADFDGSSTFRDCIFEGNRAVDDGGALYSDDTDIGIFGTTFEGNTAVDNGGALFLFDGTYDVEDCIFEGNTAGDDGGGIFSDDTDIGIFGTTFEGNTAVDNGGALFLFDGTYDVEDCIFEGNTAGDDGGGIFSFFSDAVGILRTTFGCNGAADNGGAVSYGSGGLLSVTDSLFSGNAATDTGGALYISNSDSVIGGTTLRRNVA